MQMKKRFPVFAVILITALLIASSALAQQQFGGLSFRGTMRSMAEGSFTRMSAESSGSYTVTTEAQFTIPASAETYAADAIVTTNNVNLRTGPGYSYQAFTQVHKNSVLHVEQRAYADGVTWYFGKINNMTGWIHGSFLSFNSTQPTSTPTVPVSFVAYVRLDKTNVRIGPDMNSAAFTQLNRGSVFNVTASSTASNGVTWYYGSCGQVQGWIRGDLLSTTPIIVTPSPTPTPAPAPVTPAPGYVTPVDYTAWVRVSSAEVRSGADTGYTLICTVPYGTQVHVHGLAYSAGMTLWCYVEYASGQYGYIVESQLSNYGPTQGPQIDYTDSFVGYTAMQKVLVRVAPAGQAVQRIEYKGTQVQVQGSVWNEGIKWYLVSYYGGTGYIRYDMITKTAPSVPVPTTYYGGDESPVSFSGMTLSGQTNVRSQPNLSAWVSDSVPYGTAVTVCGLCYDSSGNAWYHVVYGSSKNGYIYATLVGVYDAAAIRNYYATHTQTPRPTATVRVYTTATPNDSSSLYGYRTLAPKNTSTPVPVRTATPTPWSYTTAVPTALPNASKITEILDFSPVTLNAGQTLAVYSAPNSAAWRSDSGTASVSTNRGLWVAGYEGQWMLILYTNEYSQIRVGYINAFRLTGALPTANTLYFAPRIVRLTSGTNLTSDPLTASEVILSLSAGTEVTWLCSCNLGSNWAYVETTINGATVRGFIPAIVVGQ